MVSDKALYVLAVGVLAVGVGHRYSGRLNQSGEVAQCMLAQVEQAADRVSSRLASYVEEGGDRLAARQDSVNTRVQVAIARSQARVDRMSARVERRNAEIVRVNIQGSCPRQKVYYFSPR